MYYCKSPALSFPICRHVIFESIPCAIVTHLHDSFSLPRFYCLWEQLENISFSGIETFLLTDLSHENNLISQNSSLCFISAMFLCPLVDSLLHTSLNIPSIFIAISPMTFIIFTSYSTMKIVEYYILLTFLFNIYHFPNKIIFFWKPYSGSFTHFVSLTVFNA